jgi:hypothetical protein
MSPSSGSCATRKGWAASVPDMGSNRNSGERVSSTVEHQFRELAVAGSIPVPHVGCKPTRRKGRKTCSTVKPKGDGRSWNPPSSRFAGMTAARDNTMQDADSAVTLIRQRRGNEDVDEVDGSPSIEEAFRPASTPSEITAQASLRFVPCDSRTFRLLRVSLFPSLNVVNNFSWFHPAENSESIGCFMTRQMNRPNAL